jgi:hypothetical protein
VGIDRRRESRLNVEPRTGIVAVGHKTTLLDPAPSVDHVVRSYIDLVLSQRAEKPTSPEALRDDELNELAAKLQLPTDEVEGLVARDLERRYVTPEAAPPKRGFLKRLRS